MSATHTPTPWQVTEYGVASATDSYGSQGGVARIAVADTHAPSQANAAHIVRCVNAHDKLTADLAKAVAALRGFVAQVEASNCQQGVFSLDYERARAVLAEVESNEE